MVLYLENAEKFIKGVQELKEELFITLGSKENADIVVIVTETDKDELNVTLKDGVANISFGGGHIRFYRALTILCEALKDGKTVFTKTETPNFTQNGSMFDVARNMVFRPEIIKAIFRKQAMMGLNFFMLYLEDVFEVPEYPYFGHMRGRYSKTELKELDA